MTRITILSLVVALLALPLSADEPGLELQSLTLGLRYRMIENHLGSRVQNWSEHHQGLKLRLKLDQAARVSVSAVALNGDSFVASWESARSSRRVLEPRVPQSSCS